MLVSIEAPGSHDGLLAAVAVESLVAEVAAEAAVQAADEAVLDLLQAVPVQAEPALLDYQPFLNTDSHCNPT